MRVKATVTLVYEYDLDRKEYTDKMRETDISHLVEHPESLLDFDDCEIEVKMEVVE